MRPEPTRTTALHGAARWLAEPPRPSRCRRRTARPRRWTASPSLPRRWRGSQKSSAPAVRSWCPITAYAFSFPGLAGGDIRLSEFAGRPMLIVNTASLCGFTPQYGGLQELWTEFHSRGLMIIGVPSNDFGGQEPGGAAEITATAQNHHVAFPIAAKAVVKGANAHPFYKWE